MGNEATILRILNQHRIEYIHNSNTYKENPFVIRNKFCLSVFVHMHFSTFGSINRLWMEYIRIYRPILCKEIQNTNLLIDVQRYQSDLQLLTAMNPNLQTVLLIHDLRFVIYSCKHITKNNWFFNKSELPLKKWNSWNTNSTSSKTKTEE